MDDGELLVYARRSRLQLFVIGTGLLLLASVLILLNVQNLQYGILRIGAMVPAFLGSVLFGYAFYYNLLRLRQDQPVLERTPNSLRFHLSMLYHGEIPASELKSYGLVSYAGRKYVLVFVHHPREVAGQLNGFSRFRAKGYLRRFRTPIALPAAMLDADPKELLQDLSQFPGGNS